MRKGIHRAIFTCEEDNAYFRLGILGTKPLKGKLISALSAHRNDDDREYDIIERQGEAESGLECDVAASHVIKTMCKGHTMQVGLEVDIDQRILRVYRSTYFEQNGARFIESNPFDNDYSPGEGYCWAVFVRGKRRGNDKMGECSIIRVPPAYVFE